MGKIFLAAALAFTLYQLLPTNGMSLPLAVAVKFFLFMLFLVATLLMNFFEKREIAFVREFFKKSSRSRPESGDDVDFKT
jgi:hypothetical protein